MILRDIELKFIRLDWNTRHELLKRLSKKQRGAVVYRLYDRLHWKEVAHLMNCAYNTAKANHRHGMEKIEIWLTDQSA